MYRQARSFLASPKPTGYQAKPALDNELVRVERLILEPGQSTGRYTLPRSGMLIAAHDGIISVERPGSTRPSVEMKAGEFEWHTGPATHTITNIGKTRFEAIEAVWKYRSPRSSGASFNPFLVPMRMRATYSRQARRSSAR